MEDIIGTKKAAEILGVAQETVSRMIKKGKLEGKKLGNEWAVSVKSVYAYKESIEGKGRYDPTRGHPKKDAD